MSRELNKTHLPYLDLMRVIAALAVVFNHSEGFVLYQNYAPNTFQYWSYMLISVSCVFAVPLFFMISGILLLGREDSISHTLKHRTLRMFIVLLVFSTISYLVRIPTFDYPKDFPSAVKMIYQFGTTGSAWYLYSYLAFTLSLPLLQLMVSKMQKKHFQYLFVLFIIFEPLYRVFTYTVLGNEIWRNSSFNIEWLLTNFLIFSFWGYYIEKILTQSEFLKRAKYYIAAGIVTGVLAVVLTWHSCNVRNDDVGTQYFHWFLFFYCAAIYSIVKLIYIKFKIPDGFNKAVKLIAANAFGVYLIHSIIIDIPVIKNLFVVMDQDLGMINILSAFIYTVIVFAISFALSFILRLIPGVKKFI